MNLEDQDKIESKIYELEEEIQRLEKEREILKTKKGLTTWITTYFLYNGNYIDLINLNFEGYNVDLGSLTTDKTIFNTDQLARHIDNDGQKAIEGISNSCQKSKKIYY